MARRTVERREPQHLEVTTTDLERRCPRELARLGSVVALALKRFGACGEIGERDVQRGREAADGGPRRVLTAALEVRNPGRVKRRAVREVLLAELLVDAEFAERGAQPELGFGAPRHRWHGFDICCAAP